MINDRIKLDRIIVETPTSILYAGTNLDKKIPVAAKSMINVSTNDLVNNELAILRQLTHPNIIKLYGQAVINYSPALVMELMYKTLETCLKHNNSINEAIYPKASEVHLRIAFGLAYGLKYLHSQCIVHRDFKPSNILTNHNYTEIKIGDFGLSADLKNKSIISWRVGTPLWIAPEIAEQAIVYGSKVPEYPCKIDTWAMGQMLLQLYVNTAGVPYPSVKNVNEIYDSIIKGEHLPIPADKPLSKVISQCLTKDPAERASARQVVKELKKLKM